MLARALYSLGIVAETRAELNEAEAVGEELRALAADSDDMGIAIAARVRLGNLRYTGGNSRPRVTISQRPWHCPKPVRSSFAILQ